MDNVEMAQQGLEHAEHAHGHAGEGHPPGHAAGHDAGGHEAGAHAAPRGTRRAAVLVAVFASIAVIIEMSANDAQTDYLARTITASDLWNEYQAKSVRRTIWSEAADALAAATPASPAIPASPATPAAPASPAIGQAIARARAQAARMADDPSGDGMTQLAARAKADEEARDHAHHLHDALERSVRVLQIAIVLTGLYLATRIEALVLVGAVMGAGAIAWWLATALGLT